MFESIKNAFEGVWNSFVRTVIPIAVGSVVTWLVGIGIPVDESFSTALAGLLGLLAGALFYLVVRIVEKYKPKAGILLGVAKQPIYVEPEAAPEAEAIVARLEETA